MTYIDVFIIFIIFVSFGFGLYKGFVKETLGLLTLILAFMAAFYSYSSGYPLQWLPDGATDYGFSVFETDITGDDIASAIIFILVFLLVLLPGHLLINLLGRMVSDGPLNFFDRLLGGGFGLLRGAAIVIALVMLAGATRLPLSDWWHESRMLPSFVTGAQYAVEFLPPEYARHFQFEAPKEAAPVDEIEL